jgi:hypothetical protein
VGEAKRRKASDPTYGRNPQHGRGLVVSCPLKIAGSSVEWRSIFLDPQELRFSLLFWEKLAWPISHVVRVDGGPDEQFLEQIGILLRPRYGILGDVAKVIAQTQVRAFLDLESHEPGSWALAQGENPFLLQDEILEVGRGALVHLHRAIPVPDKDVPLNDILEFRMKRRDELLLLRHEIDSFFTSINNAADKEFELRRHIWAIDTACAAILKVAKEWNFPLRLADLRSSFELRPFAALMAGVGGWTWGAEYEMPLMGAALGVAASSLKVSKDFGMAKIKMRSSPYRYVYRFHEEIF